MITYATTSKDNFLVDDITAFKRAHFVLISKEIYQMSNMLDLLMLYTNHSMYFLIIYLK